MAQSCENAVKNSVKVLNKLWNSCIEVGVNVWKSCKKIVDKLWENSWEVFEKLKKIEISCGKIYEKFL